MLKMYSQVPMILLVCNEINKVCHMQRFVVDWVYFCTPCLFFFFYIRLLFFRQFSAVFLRSATRCLRLQTCPIRWYFLLSCCILTWSQSRTYKISVPKTHISTKLFNSNFDSPRAKFEFLLIYYFFLFLFFLLWSETCQCFNIRLKMLNFKRTTVNQY